MEIYCSFCAKSQKHVNFLVAATDNKAFMCNECIVEAAKIVIERQTKYADNIQQDLEKLIYEMF